MKTAGLDDLSGNRTRPLALRLPMPTPYTTDSPELELLAFQYFKLFAQYESVLKASGFAEAKGRDGIGIQWDRFAEEKIGSTFLTKLGPHAASADYMLDHPPMKQVFEQGAVRWVPGVIQARDAKTLFIYLRRLRNNLFHGAKFNGTFPDTWDAPGRSKVLLRHGLAILETFRDHWKSDPPKTL